VFYKLGSPLQKVLVYQSGKLIFWGAKTTEDIELSFEIMKREMKLYEVLSKKGEEESPSLD
jgi:TATA-box binding protein (TBP) (component of TFIID and TFIIIB)